MARGMPFIPPGGVAGFSEQTPAVKALLSNGSRPRRKTTRKKRTTKRKTTARKRPAKRRATARTKKPARMVKGSAAAKRHMAKLRRMRGKK